MRTVVSVLALVALVLVAAVMAADQEKPWFDMKNCAFCKELAAQPGLLEHMRHEYHNIHNGIVSVTYIDKDYRDEFAAMHQGMGKVVADMQAGKPVQMCQHCAKIGEFYQKGVRMEEVKSSDAIIVIYSSEDTALIADIQAFGARCTEELAEYAAEAKKAN